MTSMTSCPCCGGTITLYEDGTGLFSGSCIECGYYMTISRRVEAPVEEEVDYTPDYDTAYVIYDEDGHGINGILSETGYDTIRAQLEAEGKEIALEYTQFYRGALTHFYRVVE